MLSSDTRTRNSNQDKAWPPNSSGAQETEYDIQQLIPTMENNTVGLGEQIQNSNEVTQRCPQIYISPTSKKRNPSINTASISIASIITVELFVTMARLARGQTLVIMVKIGAIVSASVKNVLACRNLLHPWE